jgi:hypothetical protein
MVDGDLEAEQVDGKELQKILSLVLRSLLKFAPESPIVR